MKIQLIYSKLLKPLWLIGAILMTLASLRLQAQDGSRNTLLPITISLFTESVSLPNFRGFYRNPNWGMRVGTELYYRQRDGHQLLQNIQLGYYRHDGLQQGVFVSTAFGYRKFFGDFFADGTIGGGYLHLISGLRRYEPDGEGYRPGSQRLHKFMPTIGLGIGYRFHNVTVFSRYEAFGEMQFNYNGSPVLPHKTLHVGAGFYPFR